MSNDPIKASQGHGVTAFIKDDAAAVFSMPID